MTLGPFGPHYPVWGVSGSYLNGKATNLAQQTFDLEKVSRIIPQSPDEGIYFDAELIPERDNPDSPFSVSIRWQGHILGYMSLRDSAPLFPELSRIAASRFTPITPARLWANPAQKSFRLNYALPKPGHVAPINTPPLTEFALMPNGTALQVQGEENHFDYLSSYLPGEGSERLYLTLEFPEGADRFNVLLDGQIIGTMTATMSKKLRPPIQQFIDRGLDIAARGKLAGNQFDCQVTVNIARAHEFTEEDMLAGPSPHQELVPISNDGYALPIIWSEEEPDWSVMVYPDGTISEDNTPSLDDVEDKDKVQEGVPTAQKQPLLEKPRPLDLQQLTSVGENPFLRQSGEGEKSPDQEPPAHNQSTALDPLVPSFSVPPRKTKALGIGKQVLVGAGAFLAATIGGFILFAIMFNIGGGTDAIGWILFLLWLAGIVAAPIWAVKKVRKNHGERQHIK